MEDKLEKKLKEFLPYIIILGITFLLVPILFRLLGNNVVINNIFLMGVFPLVTFACNLHYTLKKSFDYLMLCIAPIFFVPAMFLYGIFADSAINSLIYLVAYFVSGYIGMVVGEMHKGKNKNDQPLEYTRKKRNIPQTVSRFDDELEIEENFDDIEIPQKYTEQTPSYDVTSNDDDYDLDAILNELKNRE